MGDEQDAHPALGLQPPRMPQDLGLGGDVERGGRLVAEQQPGSTVSAPGDHHPLQHPAGQLVRVLAEVPLGVVEPDGAQQLHRPRRARAAGPPAVEPQRLGEEVADPAHRVDAGARVLEDHRDLGAAQRAAAARGRRSARRSRRRAPRPRPRHRSGRSPRTVAGGDRLAGAGLADQPDHLARRRPRGTPRRGSAARPARAAAATGRRSRSSAVISGPARRSGRRAPRRRC